MLLAVSDERALAAWLILLEFGCLTLLGFFLVQLMHWEMRVNHSRSAWLATMRQGAGRLRILRRRLDKMDGEWPEIPMVPAFKGKWKVVRWVFKAVSAVKWARS